MFMLCLLFCCVVSPSLAETLSVSLCANVTLYCNHSRQNSDIHTITWKLNGVSIISKGIEENKYHFETQGYKITNDTHNSTMLIIHQIKQYRIGIYFCEIGYTADVENYNVTYTLVVSDDGQCPFEIIFINFLHKYWFIVLIIFLVVVFIAIIIWIIYGNKAKGIRDYLRRSLANNKMILGLQCTSRQQHPSEDPDVQIQMVVPS
ncbi:putative immunoglobulin-like domain containing protein [Namao virus]|nr:putative immunoglobulin-like domain containing protein [Namao virus]